jgi:predicted MFS family arabinose efflux permease
MPADADWPEQHRTTWIVGAASNAAVLAALAVLLSPSGTRVVAIIMVLAGLAAGITAVIAGALPPRLRQLTVMERLNNAAFTLVVAVTALLVSRVAEPWTAIIPGLVGGLLIGRALRLDRPKPTADPQR